MKLLVWEETGRIAITQYGGLDNSVIDDYGRDGKIARFVDKLPHNASSYFVDKGRLRRRTALRASLDRSAMPAGGVAKIKGVPAGAQVVVADGLNSHVHQADGRIIHLMIEDPGRYTVHVEAFPHLPQQFSLTVK